MLAKQREQLTEVSIKIADIEEEKKEVVKEFKEQLAPLLEERRVAIDNLKKKSEVVTEPCYKFFDEESSMVGYYNKEGRLVSSRAAFQEEKQKTLFAVMRDGTND